MIETSPVASPVESSPTPKLSPVEGMKIASRQLRGTLGEVLASDADHFGEADKNLIKFHGSYQQEDRDARKTRKKDGVGKHYMFMVRCKIPGGRLSAAQYLALDTLASQVANGTLRFTSRQGIQFHGILKDHLKDAIAGINATLLTTLGACGDVNRNVMACPAPCCDGLHAALQETAATLAAHLAPRTRAYHEIWLNGQPISTNSSPDGGGDGTSIHDVEPLYGKTYLPRKFKTGLALPNDNCIDVYAQDLGLLAIVEEGQLAGYNVVVGGGMGMTHGNHATFPHIGRPICYVPAGAIVMAAEAVVRLFRDHGNRADRKRARIKYLVHDWGVERFREVLAGYMGGALTPPRPVEVTGFETHLGWHEQGDGRFYYGLCVENGRVKDEGPLRLRTGLRTLVERLQPELRLTPLQDILLCGLEASARGEIERTLREFGIVRSEDVSRVQSLSMACPAIPTCGLAISESERALPGIIDELEVELTRLGLDKEAISVRMTGCPNGCVRPYQSDIGIVGRSGDKYTVFVGGHVNGHRLNFALEDLVPRAAIVPTLRPLLERFRTDRQTGESFGDYCHRLGEGGTQALLPPKEKPRGDHPRLGANDSPAAEGSPTNGASHHPTASVRAAPSDGAALAEPQTRVVALPQPRMRNESFLVGSVGEELIDYAYGYHGDGQVRDTVVRFYEGDRRAAAARPGDALRREAIYQGRVDAHRLHDARKLSDTWFVGPAGAERRDYRIDYLPDGRVAQTVVFHYEGDLRAAETPSDAALRRQVAYEGRLG